MPYSNLPKSKWSKMDSCVNSVMQQGKSKPSAIAICYSSLTGKNVHSLVSDFDVNINDTVSIGNQVKLHYKCNYDGCNSCASWKFSISDKEFHYCNDHVQGATRVLSMNGIKFNLKKAGSAWLSIYDDKGKFVTIDDRVVFIGGPSQGGGSSGAGGVGAGDQTITQEVDEENLISSEERYWREEARRFDKEEYPYQIYQYGEMAWGEDLENLSDEEKMAINLYTTQAYQEINSKLRHGEEIPEMSDFWYSAEELFGENDDWEEFNYEYVDEHFDNMIGSIDNAISNSRAKEDVVVYRNVNQGTFSGFNPGDVFVDNGYVSTSLKKSEAAKFGGQNIEIRVSQGTPSLFLNGISDMAGELEVLLGRDVKFRVVSSEGENLVVEVVQ